MTTSRTKNDDEFVNLNKSIKRAVINFKPPEQMTVSEWADKYRRLSPENSAEAGPWRTSRTPYLKEIMDAFTDPKVHRIAVAASSQVGKTEMEMNMISYMIDIDPGPGNVCPADSRQRERYGKAPDRADDPGHKAASEKDRGIQKPGQ